MNTLANLHPSFRVEATEPPSTRSEIQQLQLFSSIEIPKEYVSIITDVTEVEILVQESKYLRIWSASGCIEMNQEYEIQRYIPSSLAIGDDEGGSAFLYMNGKKGFGLYKLGFGDLDPDDAEYVASSLFELLIEGIGVNVI